MVGGSSLFAQGTSNNFRIDESAIGPGGNLESNSANFSTEAGQQAIGGTGAVNSASTNFRGQGGSETTDDPRLSCVLNNASINFGAFSTSVTLTANATFSVLNYTSYGYNVSMIGTSPTMGSHSLANMNPATTVSTGTEQFGINLVANTSPTAFGAFPVQVPDGTFSSGDAASGYDTPNNYKFVPGDTIASAAQSSGQTDYTISYVVNVSNNTPGGTYTANHVILCTGTY
jgi:hypothetical protein